MDSENDDEGEQAAALIRYCMLLMLLCSCDKIKQVHTGKPLVISPPTKKQLAHKPPIAKKKKKKLYLTFDDGPNKGTSKVWRIMQQENVPVTFFIIGEHVYASRYQQNIFDSLQASNDVAICNHSYTHALHNNFNGYYAMPDTVVQDFNRCTDSIKTNNTICRTPGRNIWRMKTITCTDLKNSIAAADSLKKAGYVIMGWDLEWHYDGSNNTLKNSEDELLVQIDSVFKYNKTKTINQLVLLAHDQVYADAIDSAILHQLIKKLKLRDDIELELATNYPGIGQ
jgi:peptidoglycan/xylan/chitin deacetylase (PgdA/CDA1 family)